MSATRTFIQSIIDAVKANPDVTVDDILGMPSSAATKTTTKSSTSRSVETSVRDINIEEAKQMIAENAEDMICYRLVTRGARKDLLCAATVETLAEDRTTQLCKKCSALKTANPLIKMLTPKKSTAAAAAEQLSGLPDCMKAELKTPPREIFVEFDGNKFKFEGYGLENFVFGDIVVKIDSVSEEITILGSADDLGGVNELDLTSTYLSTLNEAGIKRYLHDGVISEIDNV